MFKQAAAGSLGERCPIPVNGNLICGFVSLAHFSAITQYEWGQIGESSGHWIIFLADYSYI